MEVVSLAIRLVTEGFMKGKKATVDIDDGGISRINVASQFRINKEEYERSQTTTQGKRRPVSFLTKNADDEGMYNIKVWRPYRYGPNLKKKRKRNK